MAKLRPSLRLAQEIAADESRLAQKRGEMPWCFVEGERDGSVMIGLMSARLPMNAAITVFGYSDDEGAL